MQKILRMILVDADPDSREAFKAMVSGLDSVWIEADCARYHEALELFNELSSDVVAVSLDEDIDLALDLIRELRQQCPDVQLFALSSSGDSQQILRAMRAGANEYLLRPVALEDLLQAIDRARTILARERGEHGDLSRVITFVGTSGGVGCTSIATNVAVLLAQDPRYRVLYLDLDLVLGDADIHLDIVHDYTLFDVVQNISRLDFSLLKRAVVQHSSGLYFLPHPSSAAEVGAVEPEDVKRLLGLLRSTFSHIIVDTSKKLDRIDREAISNANLCVVVAQLNVSCVRNVTRVLETLEAEEQDQVCLVFNRVGSREVLFPMEKIEQMIGRPVDCTIPNDWPTFAAAHDAGQPAVLLQPESRAMVAIRELTAKIEPNCTSTRTTTPEKKRWLAGWFGRR